jgi:molecular chaperone GrpE
MGEQDKATHAEESPEPLRQEVPDAAPAAAEEEPEQTREQSLEELHLMLEDARSKADEHWNELLRSRAEQDNLRKRAQRDVEQAHKFALEGFVRELLPVKDSLELGLAAAKESDAEVAKVVEGVELTLKMLTAAMEKFSVEEIDPLHQAFDPQRHQAMTMQPSEEHDPSTVLAVYQKGYLLNGRLIRPAMVVVASPPEAK